MEAVDDVVGGDVGDGGACVEEPLDVRPQGLATLLFAHVQVVASGGLVDGALEVVEEELLQVLP